MGCVLCECEQEIADRVWYAYAARLNLKDATRAARRQLTEHKIAPKDVAEHLFEHHYVQPSPPGRTLHRSLALQEAMTTFPRYLYHLLRALYRAKALSERQIYAMFYLRQAPDGDHLRERMRQDLQRLVFRSFLYRHWPENQGALSFEDPGPYYFLNRQAIPIVERLEGVELPFSSYTTSVRQVEEFNLEHDARMLDLIVALREKLYRRSFPWKKGEFYAHLGIDHWYAPLQLYTELDIKTQNGQNVVFTPAAVLGIRLESRDGELSTVLPLWLEYDRGTDDADAVGEHLLYYAHYYSCEKYRKMFPRLAQHRNPGPLVCVCESPYRRDEVMDAFYARVGERPLPVYFVDRRTFCHDPYQASLLLSVSTPDARYDLLERVLHHNRVLLERHVFSATDHLTDPPAEQILSEQAGQQRRSPRQSQQPPAALEGVDLSVWGDADDERRHAPQRERA